MRKLLAPIAALMMIAVAACGSGDGGSSSGSGSDSGTTRLKVGVVPIVDVAPLYLGEEHGFFTDHHIDLELVKETGGAAAIPGIVSGEFQFSFSNVSSIILAAAQNLPLRIVAEADSSTGDPTTDFSGVVVSPDSPIRSVKDLAGKTVAVNNLKNIGEVTIRKAVQDAGGDPSSVTFTELDFTDMPAAVADHQVDAAWVVEPFLTEAVQQGARNIASNFTVVPNLTVATYFTSDEYMKQHPDVVQNFRAAIRESLRYAQAHPAEVRRIVTTYTTVTPDLAQQIKLPVYPQQVDVPSLTTVAKLMHAYGITDRTVAVGPLLATR